MLKLINYIIWVLAVMQGIRYQGHVYLSAMTYKEETEHSLFTFNSTKLWVLVC